MGLGSPMLFLALALLVAMQLLTQKANLASLAGPMPARQIAYNMRLYHQAAIAYKLANPAATGVLPVAAPTFLTDWRFTSCAAAKSLVTYGSGFTASMTRLLSDELLRQSIAPPEFGIMHGSPDAIGTLSATIQRGYADGIGIANGVVINNGFASLTPACPIPQGVAAIQTQVSP